MEYFDRSSPRESNLAGDRPGGPLGGPLGGPQGNPMDSRYMGGPMGGPIGIKVGVAASATSPAIADPFDIVHFDQCVSAVDGSGISGDLASVGGVASQTRSHGPPGQPLDGLLTSTKDFVTPMPGGCGAAGWSFGTARRGPPRRSLGGPTLGGPRLTSPGNPCMPIEDNVWTIADKRQRMSNMGDGANSKGLSGDPPQHSIEYGAYGPMPTDSESDASPLHLSSRHSHRAQWSVGAGRRLTLSS